VLLGDPDQLGGHGDSTSGHVACFGRCAEVGQLHHVGLGPEGQTPGRIRLHPSPCCHIEAHRHVGEAREQFAGVDTHGRDPHRSVQTIHGIRHARTGPLGVRELDRGIEVVHSVRKEALDPQSSPRGALRDQGPYLSKVRQVKPLARGRKPARG
jgi:hypothetical protein